MTSSRSDGEEPRPDLGALTEAINNDDCRAILRTVSEPMTADEISEAASIPRSTAYRNLNLLAEASLVEEKVKIRHDGHHISQYVLAVDSIEIEISGDRGFEITISRDSER
jgi:predicted transcriptional regulator